MKPKKSFKPTPPTLREKKRYISFRLLCDSRFPKNAVSSALKDVFFSLFGSFGTAELGYAFIDFDSASGKGIIRCERSKVEKACSAILFLKSAAGKTVVPKILRVSGTIKGVS